MSRILHTNPDRAEAIRCGNPVTECGLTFYPITMRQYEAFVNTRDVLTLRMASLPVRYMVMDYISALFAMEADAAANGNGGGGMFWSFMRLLYLSLRIEMNADTLAQAIFYRHEPGGSAINHLSICQCGKTVELTPADISAKIRPLIAALNGLELPDESENIDLIRDAEAKKAFYARNAAPLDVNIDDLIASVAYLSHVREIDVYDWTVREFELRRRAIDRDKRYTLNAQAEMSGMITFKSGNPAPSWCYDTLDDSLGTITLSALGQSLKGAAEKSG